MIEASIEHTKPTGTHSEKEGGFQLAEDLGDWHKKKDLSLTNKNVHGFNNLIKFMSCSKLLDQKLLKGHEDVLILSDNILVRHLQS